MIVNQILLDILNNINHSQTSSILLLSNDIPLISINEDSINLRDTNLESKLIPIQDISIQENQNIDQYLKEIKAYNPTLNHIGIGYKVANINKEIEVYKHLIKDMDLHLYEEESNERKLKWLFIGNTNEWQDPLCEIVLSELPHELDDQWYPHIQIDVDTKANDATIKQLCKVTLGMNFLKWNIDIPDYGVVLEMGKLGRYEGINLWLGIGTNLRNTQYHREHLKLII